MNSGGTMKPTQTIWLGLAAAALALPLAACGGQPSVPNSTPGPSTSGSAASQSSSGPSQPASGAGQSGSAAGKTSASGSGGGQSRAGGGQPGAAAGRPGSGPGGQPGSGGGASVPVERTDIPEKPLPPNGGTVAISTAPIPVGSNDAAGPCIPLTWTDNPMPDGVTVTVTSAKPDPPFADGNAAAQCGDTPCQGFTFSAANAGASCAEAVSYPGRTLDPDGGDSISGTMAVLGQISCSPAISATACQSAVAAIKSLGVSHVPFNTNAAIPSSAPASPPADDPPSSSATTPSPSKSVTSSKPVTSSPTASVVPDSPAPATPAAA